LFGARLRLASVLCALILLAGCATAEKKEAVRPPPPVISQPRPPAPLPEPPPSIDQSELPPGPNPMAEILALRPGPPPPPVPPGATRAALLLPLSGRLADLGQGIARASQIALFEVGDSSLEILSYNTKGTPAGAEQAAKLALYDGASMILGPLLSSSVKVVAPVAAAADVPVISFSSDSRIAGSGVFVMGFTPETEVTRIVQFAVADGARRIAVLAPSDAYGAAVVAAAQLAAASRSAAIVAIELYSTKTESFTPVLTKLIKAAGKSRPPAPPGGAQAAELPLPFDALLIADGGARLKAIAAALPGVGLSRGAARLLGTGAWDEAGIGREPALVGGWFAAPAPEFRRDFEQTYQTLFGQSPPRLATLGYDATAIASVVARERGAGSVVKDLIADPQGFLGRDGLFRFTSGGVADRQLAVLEVERDGLRVISAPARSFSGS
jgi:ABC-type branched-subunit amino acid transport system substrate-binding protein